MSILRECFPKILELLKVNLPSVALIQFIKINHGFYNGAEAEHFDQKNTPKWVQNIPKEAD